MGKRAGEKSLPAQSYILLEALPILFLFLRQNLISPIYLPSKK
ncbi:hypothetical protein B23_2622 [Geobacillus thermoleovorans B23]|nr:hypothetical protein B23_2622 [Geobacillus thermoleovorans B23]